MRTSWSRWVAECSEKRLFPPKLDVPKSAKTGMKELFAQPKLKKDGTQSKVLPLLTCSVMCPSAWTLLLRWL